MKARVFISVFAAALFVAIVIGPGARSRADKGYSSVLPQTTATGVGYAIAGTVADEAGAVMSFQLFGNSGTPTPSADLQQSNDQGTTWSSVHTFNAVGEVFTVNACGSCQFRGKLNVCAGCALGITGTVSGRQQFSAPTLTPTVTPTVTPTSTITNTPTRTPTVTPTP